MGHKSVLVVGLVLLAVLTTDSIRTRRRHRDSVEPKLSEELEPNTESKLAFYRVRPEIKERISSIGSFDLVKYRKQIVAGGVKYFLKATHTVRGRRSSTKRVYHLNINAPFESQPLFVMEKVATYEVGEINDGPGCKTHDEEIASHWPLLYRLFQSQLMEQLKLARRIQPTYGVFGEKSCRPVKQTVTFITRLDIRKRGVHDLKLIEPCCLTLEAFEELDESSPIEPF